MSDYAVERAADVIRSATWHTSGSHVLTVVPLDAAQALADAGLLVTDEMRAVLDAAVRWRLVLRASASGHSMQKAAIAAVTAEIAALDAYIETIKEDQ